MDDMEVDENPNKKFVPLSNNPLHKIHNQIHKHGAKDVIEQDIYVEDAFNKLGSSASSSFVDMALPSSPISDVSSAQLQPTSSNQVVVHAPAIRQANSPARKSSLKVRNNISTYDYYHHGQHSFYQAKVGLHTSPITPTRPTMTKHVTWKSPEVESARAIAQGEALSGTLSALTLSSSQSPFKLAGYSADAYCFSDDIAVVEKETQGPAAVLQAGKSKTTIIAFTPRQRTFTHRDHITRSNLGRLLKPSSVQRSVQGVVGNSYTTLNGAWPTMREQHATPPKIGRKLGSPVSAMSHQTTFPDVVGPIDPEAIEHQGSDPPVTRHTSHLGDPSRRHTEATSSSERFENHAPSSIPVELRATALGTPTVFLAAECYPEIVLMGSGLSSDETHSDSEKDDQEMTWAQELFGPSEFVDTSTPHVSVIPGFDTMMDQGALVNVLENHDVSSTVHADLLNPSRWVEDTPAPSCEIPVRAPAHQGTLPEPSIVIHNKPIPPLTTPVFGTSLLANGPRVGTAVTTTADKEETIHMISMNHEKEQGQPVNRGHPVKELPSTETTVRLQALDEGSKQSIQLQVGKRSGSRPEKGREVVGKRKREGEAAAAVQPVLKTLRKETPDKRQMSMLSDSSAISSASSSDQLPQPWALGTFIPRNRRLSLDSSNTEPPRDPRRIHSLKLPMVIEWKTQLDRISYLHQQGKISQADVEKLEEVLMLVRANMDHPFLTAKWIKAAKLVPILKEFRHRGNGVFSVASKRVAREIFDFWKNAPKFGMACM